MDRSKRRIHIQTIADLSAHLLSHRELLYLFFHRLDGEHSGIIRKTDFERVWDGLQQSGECAELAGTPVDRIFRRVQKAVLTQPFLYLAVRERVARWRYVQLHTEVMECREIDVAEYLEAKERVMNGTGPGEDYVLEVDLSPFERGFPKIEDPQDIGRGVEYLNTHLCHRILEGAGSGRDDLVDFLRLHSIDGRQLMINDQVMDTENLRALLDEAVKILSAPDPGDWERKLARIGFEAGWGDSPQRTAQTMGLLAQVLDDPTPEHLADFLSRLPMIFDIVIVSPHGFFGQANVLGKPDTGGQVVYILDQVRALEHEMRESIRRQGLNVEPNIIVLTRQLLEAGDTSCDRRLEPIVGTEHARILRVPFRDEAGEVLPEWISRFEIWPYLERYAREAERELIAELAGRRPDFIIGNYSDGNLVASLLADSLGVTQCNIAHALEKTKYKDSDIHWKDLEDEYHFSCQFTADLLAMNTADFIITSTFQEIAGTADTVGQYESYSSFTLPGLYRVVAGIDCRDPKFNIVSPGADPNVFFPFTQTHRRPAALIQEVEQMVLEGMPTVDARGRLADPDKPILFAMSRLDAIKNMAGLVRWYAESPEMQEHANLLLVGSTLDPQRSDDRDERRQIELLHSLIDGHGLDDKVRWIEMQTDKNVVGGLYRFVADRRGAFIQPALFEAFGLTVVEAMSSGLPTLATRHGGPLETIEDGVSGFHIDPTSDADATRVIVDFLERAAADPGVWDAISQSSIERIEARYTWKRYASRLLSLSRIYGFWRHISSLQREETRRYLEMFYGLMYRPRAATVSRGDQAPVDESAPVAGAAD